MYSVQRCRSHEVNSIPAAWETIFSGDEAAAVRHYWSRTSGKSASGDRFRVVDEAGVEQALLGAETCGPMY